LICARLASGRPSRARARAGRCSSSCRPRRGPTAASGRSRALRVRSSLVELLQLLAQELFAGDHAAVGEADLVGLARLRGLGAAELDEVLGGVAMAFRVALFLAQVIRGGLGIVGLAVADEL